MLVRNRYPPRIKSEQALSGSCSRRRPGLRRQAAPSAGDLITQGFHSAPGSSTIPVARIRSASCWCCEVGRMFEMVQLLAGTNVFLLAFSVLIFDIPRYTLSLLSL